MDWDKVTNYLENDDNEGTGATEKTAWGYTREGYAYEPKDDMMRLRGFNAARQDNGNVLVNAPVSYTHLNVLLSSVCLAAASFSSALSKSTSPSAMDLKDVYKRQIVT